MIMMMNYLCEKVDRRKTLCIIPSRNHSWKLPRPSIMEIFYMLWGKFEPAQNMKSHFSGWNCGVTIDTTIWRNRLVQINGYSQLKNNNIYIYIYIYIYMYISVYIFVFLYHLHSKKCFKHCLLFVHSEYW